jgi:multidrug efflux pump subunit AcrB
MWLVRVALQRPYTFVVMSLLIVVVGVLSIIRMPTDIFPNVDIPVISVVWNYGGLPPDDMERRITSNFERYLTTVVNDIDHVESQTLTGVAVIKIFFQPQAKIEEAIAQVTAVSQGAVRMMPPGATPPLIIRYSASNVPILQLALGSESLSEQQLFDMGINYVRADIVTVPGAQVPWPAASNVRL